MTLYRVVVAAVDGVTEFTLQTNSKPRALAFLKEADHEGSTVSLDVRETWKDPSDGRSYSVEYFDNPQDVYKQLTA